MPKPTVSGPIGHRDLAKREATKFIVISSVEEAIRVFHQVPHIVRNVAAFVEDHSPVVVVLTAKRYEVHRVASAADIAANEAIPAELLARYEEALDDYRREHGGLW